MVTLRRLIASIPAPEVRGNLDPELTVRGVTGDSRAVGPGWVFVALRGDKLDGHDFAADALSRGAAAVVAEDDANLPDTIPLILTRDSRLAYGRMAAEFFGNPGQEMTMVALTGTNGKTTTSWMIEQVVRTAGGRPGVIGTVNYRYPGKGGETVVLEAPLTTPEPMMLQGLLRRMKDAGVTHVILEASSHSLDQKRLAGLSFDAAVFTNLSRDHLDYHGDMESYFAAKCRLFDEYLKPEGIAVVAMESGGQPRDCWGKALVARLGNNGMHPFSASKRKGAYITCGFEKNCIVRAEDIRQDIDGLSCAIDHAGTRLSIRSGLIGSHNVSNMLLAAGVGFGLGLDHDIIARGLREVGQVPGRLERVTIPPAGEERPRVFVDYAHTPDALAHVLGTLVPVTPGRLFCIFGCGGDRDKGKRSMMGKAAGQWAEGAVITSDNPRSEKPADIIGEIEKGVKQAGVRKTGLDELFALSRGERGYAVIEDRRRAVHQVCARAKAGDVVLIAGKGHETYQITAEGKRFFDDRIEARNSGLRWTAGKLVTAASGQLLQPGGDVLLGEISTDTRTLQPGDIFLALTGENFDGHDYIGAAVEKGAAAVVVARDCMCPDSVAVVRVKDTLRALGDLARYRRRALAPDIRVAGITGSCGKTTVKEMTAAIFSASFSASAGRAVLKTLGNFNNLVGLPLTLFRADGGHRAAILEMGMNCPGEIGRLTEIAGPEIGCITNVRAAHLEGLGSIEGVARAKGELFSAMPDDSVRVVNYDDPQVRKLGRGYVKVIGFAATPAGRRFKPEVRATRIVSLGERGMRFTLRVGDWQRRIAIPAAGDHNVANSCAAAAIATAAGIDPEVIVKGLSGYVSGDKRLQIMDLPGGIRIVNDAYNANPASMAAALKTVRGFGAVCRRAALLGDMFELGKAAGQAHGEIGRLAGELGYDYLGVTGEFAETVGKAAAKAGMNKAGIKVCQDKEELANWVAELIRTNKIGRGDWLLLKGSRGMRMEQVLARLEQILTKENN